MSGELAIRSREHEFMSLGSNLRAPQGLESSTKAKRSSL